MANGLIISVSGPSGVGKGTVLAELEKVFPGIGHSISVTTRNPRGQEQDGVEYYFRTKEQFEEMIKNGEIVEYDQYVDNYYGTPAKPLERMSKNGQDVLLDLTIEGSVALKEKFPEDAITIYILPTSFKELEERLRGRGTETEEKIAQRMATARQEVKRVNEFDYIVINDNLADAVNNIESIIRAEKLKTYRHTGIEENL